MGADLKRHYGRVHDAQIRRVVHLQLRIDNPSKTAFHHRRGADGVRDGAKAAVFAGVEDVVLPVGVGTPISVVGDGPKTGCGLAN